MNNLFDYQQAHCRILIEAIKKHGRALDCSITGAGKTYSSIALCKELGLKPFIICPKSMIQTWCNILKKDFQTDFYGIVNYESFINGNYYNMSLKKLVNPLLHISTETKYTENKSKIIKTIDWNENKIPDDMIFIFDEAHRCKNHSTRNGIILSKLALTNAKILLISATIIDKDIYSKILVNVFRLNEYEYSPKRGLLSNSQLMSKLHTILFPEYGNRMRYDDVKDKFKSNLVFIDVEEMINATEIQKNYIYLKQAIKNIKKKMRKTSGLGTIIRTLQKIEILKVPKFVEIAEKSIAENKSVVVFFNYNASIYHFCDNLSFKTDCIVFGEQNSETRLKNIDNFNSGKSKIIICNIKAGGVSISLHDTLGLNQRVSLISPTWSAQDLIQCLGRIHRANAKSDAIQRIIFAKDTDEEIVSRAISRKIENIGLLNDNSRDSYEFITNIDEFNELLELYADTDIIPNSVDNIIDKELDEELSDDDSEDHI